jgi:MYXO-CTERM domain-containing protein
MRRSRFCYAALLATAASTPVEAQDALRGKRLYLDAAREVETGVSCVDCHGGLPGGLYGIGRAANDPARLALAIDSIPPMTPFRGRLTAVDLADLAAYLGDPLVPSPQLTVTVSRPDGDAGPADLIDFGTVMAGAASEEVTVELRNTGQLGLAITSAPEVLGVAAAEMSWTAVECAAGQRLAAQQACRLGLRFAPTGADGPRAARLRIPHDWVGGAAAVALVGRVGDPSAPADPDEPPASSSGCQASTASQGRSVGLLFIALGLVALLGHPRRRGGFGDARGVTGASSCWPRRKVSEGRSPKRLL